jgi:hypothetical protein
MPLIIINLCYIFIWWEFDEIGWNRTTPEKVYKYLLYKINDVMILVDLSRMAMYNFLEDMS